MHDKRQTLARFDSFENREANRKTLIIYDL